ncbi:MAG: hypothetical protein QOJ94_2028 [Sphingomonadales bacterium]|jgi:hypothetical protein|nr:hypothetical protein [Sphingomonadales bacterium]
MKPGVWAAWTALAAALAYDAAQILEVSGLLRDPLDRILIFAPSLLLAPAFVVAVSATLDGATPEQRTWRRASTCLALLYAAMVGFVYVVQLGAVIPADLAGGRPDVTPFACCAPGRPLTSVDLLGYTYMAVSLLLLAPTYRRPALRTLLVANGLLAPILIGQLRWPALIWLGALWIPFFAAAMVLLALELGRRPDAVTREGLARER